ncbi:hypothetical protein JQS43_20320 [Natronosporangium hydrolyticum]|uniref:Uncharacterized protein n=1 Tax=Natronosporangium hydrolyticum TaxID=2811111 RepID=A0A895YCE1_9ACTN|nr:hypothetical protein [Natronosporangium hydrolyticum]QSB13872.1 hypothetical protein JQS43_20320 [Natronosporangium hydrolyticum]
MTVPHQSNRSGKSARSAYIPPHRNGVARITHGLEAAILDHEPMRIASLDPDAGPRVYQLAVAGPAALLVAKLIKLGERVGQGAPERIHAKDALDVLRILQATHYGTLVAGLRSHRSSEYAKSVSEDAMAYLTAYGRGTGALFAQLAAEAVGGDPVTGASFAALADRLLAAVDS